MTGRAWTTHLTEDRGQLKLIGTRRILVITAAREELSLSSNNRIRIAPKPQEAGKIASLHLRREPTYPAASPVVQISLNSMRSSSSLDSKVAMQ